MGFIDDDFIVEHRLNGILHRPNGPSEIWRNGDWGWWLYDKRHRYYGPQSWHGSWFTHGNRTRW